MYRTELAIGLFCFFLLLSGLALLIGFVLSIVRRSTDRQTREGSSAGRLPAGGATASEPAPWWAGDSTQDHRRLDDEELPVQWTAVQRGFFRLPPASWGPLLESLVEELQQRQGLSPAELRRLQERLAAASQPGPSTVSSPPEFAGAPPKVPDFPTVPDFVEVVEAADLHALKSDPTPATPMAAAGGAPAAPGPAVPARPAPWDLPDPPPRAPRKSLAQWSQGFMEERNIRWGELASGLLIVGSAMGLVLSLRRELQDTIPYFPALLFLLISGAIHYAGLYTLSRWRLRSTSRGLLLISLLLVPLNFLAGVLFNSEATGQRPLSDPWLWIALGVGCLGLGWITWTAARILLRKGQASIFIPVMVAGVGMVALNRIPWETWLPYSAATFLPLTVAAAIPLLMLGHQFSRRGRVSAQSLNRSWMVGGIGFYNLGAAGGLLVMREPGNWQLISGLTAAMGVWMVARYWCVFQQIQGTPRTAGWGFWLPLRIERGMLGFALVTMAAWTVGCPRDFLCLSLLYAASAMVMAERTRWYPFVPLAVAWLAVALIVIRGFALGLLTWSESIGPAEWVEVAINGRVAVIFMLAGGLLVCSSGWIRASFTGRKVGLLRAEQVGGGSTPQQIQRWNSLTATGFVGCGGLLALLAAYMPRADQWDAILGTSLLYSVALFVIGSALWGGYRTRGRSAMTIIGTLLLVAAGLEASFGNRDLVPRWAAAEVGVWTRLVGVALVTASCLVLAMVIERIRRPSISDSFSELARGPAVTFSSAGLAVGVCGLLISLLALPLEPFSLPLSIAGTGLAVVTVIASLGQTTARGTWSEWSTFLGATFVVGSVFQATPERPATLDTAQFFYTWTLVVAGWWVGSQWIASRDSRFESGAAGPPLRPRDLVAILLPFSLILVAATGMVGPIQREIWAVAPVEISAAWQLPTAIHLASSALAIWSLILLLRTWLDARSHHSLSTQESMLIVTMAVVLWTGLWAIQGARWDGDFRAATAARWSVTVGSLVLAVGSLGLIRIWKTQANETPRGPVSEHRLLGAGSTTRSIRQGRLWIAYGSLTASVAWVFALTAIAISGFLLIGPEVRGVSPQATWLGRLRTDVSYGIPIAGLLAAVLMQAVNERQRHLAMAGSYLLRSVVVFQLLLVLSPHPQLATEWFVQIVQMVSAGMTIYGWLWYVNRRQCRTRMGHVGWRDPIRMHTLFNAALIVGLVSLVVARYAWAPNEPLGWLQAVGNWVGIGTALLYLPLLWVVYLRRWPDGWFLPLTLGGIVGVTMWGVSWERGSAAAVGQAFVVLAWGWVGLALILGALHVRWPRLHGLGTQAGVGGLPALFRERWTWFAAERTLGWGLISSLILVYSLRGFEAQPLRYWQFFGMLGSLSVVGHFIGSRRPSILAPYWLLILSTLLVWYGVVAPPQRVLPPDFDQPWGVLGLASMLTAGVWLARYLWQRYCKQRRGPRAGLWYGRAALFICLFGLSVVVLTRGAPALRYVEAMLLAMCGGYAVAALWCDRERFRVAPGAWLLWIVVTALSSSTVVLATGGPAYREVALVVSSGFVVLVWGLWLSSFPKFLSPIRQLGVPRVAAWHHAQRRWLPRLGLGMAGILVGIVGLWQVLNDPVLNRQWVCFAPLCCGLGFIWFANDGGRPWQRYVAIALLTVTAFFLSWTALPAGERWWWGVMVQNYWVAGLGFLVYGFGVVHWLRQADSWRFALERSAVVLMGLAVTFLVILLTCEFQAWIDQRPQPGTEIQTSLIAIMTLALAMAMVAMALLSRQSAVSLTLAQRKAFVYGGQGLLAALVAHSALAIPWLWGFGLREYWPYIAMALAFGGIAMWHWLQRRQLTVLAEPLATNLFFFPAVAAVLSLGLQSQADRTLVMLLCGMVYGTLAVTHPGFWTRAGAFAFGNLALWLFIHKYPGWSFQQHPQLWLIPPAVTALAISRWEQQRLNPAALVSIRYLALAVIYVSSTSEIFIQGLGRNLAPPMILATLAVLGMLSGMALKIREYIYLGALFLLVAMFTMVSHAQQQLNHVWPWWAFGISLGIATMVFFGIFEQQRNQRRKSRQSPDQQLREDESST